MHPNRKAKPHLEPIYSERLKKLENAMPALQANLELHIREGARLDRVQYCTTFLNLLPNDLRQRIHATQLEQEVEKIAGWKAMIQGLERKWNVEIEPRQNLNICRTEDEEANLNDVEIQVTYPLN